MALVSVFKDKDKDFVIKNIPFEIGSFCLEYKGDLEPFITSYLDFENFINENKQYILQRKIHGAGEKRKASCTDFRTWDISGYGMEYAFKNGQRYRCNEVYSSFWSEP